MVYLPQIPETGGADTLSIKPNLQLLVYPGGFERFEPQKGSPLIFIVCGNGDSPERAKGMAEVYIKYRDVNIPAEPHSTPKPSMASVYGKLPQALL